MEYEIYKNKAEVDIMFDAVSTVETVDEKIDKNNEIINEKISRTNKAISAGYKILSKDIDTKYKKLEGKISISQQILLDTIASAHKDFEEKIDALRDDLNKNYRKKIKCNIVLINHKIYHSRYRYELYIDGDYYRSFYFKSSAMRAAYKYARSVRDDIRTAYESDGKFHEEFFTL